MPFLFSVHITNVPSTNFWKTIMRVSLNVFAPTMPNVGSRYRKISFEIKTAFGFEKKYCWGRIPGFHLSDKKKVYLWTLDYGDVVSGGGGEALRLFFGKHVLAIFENLFDSIGTEELFSNVHEPIETMPYFFCLYHLSVRAVYYCNPFDFYPFDTQISIF